ncbi:MAG: C25 family cysteine peptidase [Bacteroidia bacterium]
MNLKPFLFILFAFLFSKASAQKVFGNEWIKQGQSYYKVVIWQNGVYRINQSTFTNSGIAVGSVDPRNIQVIQFGKELPVFVSGESDGTFDTGDYIEFYAKRTDGTFDKYLYKDTSSFLNPYVSSISDTALVYITWGNNPSAFHFTSYVNTNFGGFTPESYYLQKEIQRFNHTYYFGQPIISEYNYHSSEYLEGEGWSSVRFGKNFNDLNFSLSTKGYFSAGPEPVFKFRLSGASDYSNANPDHHHLIRLSTDNSSYSTVFDTIYEGYTSFQKSIPISASMMGGSNIYFRFTHIDDLTSTADGGTVSYAELTYPKNFDLFSTAYAELNIRSTSTASDVFLQFLNYSGSSPVLYDLTSLNRIPGNFNGNQLRFLLKRNVSGNNLVLFDSTNVQPLTLLEPVSFAGIDTTQHFDFIIVTHKTLLPKATEYAQYRAQRYNVLLLTTEQIENTFTFGLHHPLAIRHLADYLITKQDSAPGYLLLLGRGLQHDYVRLPQHNWLNLVPQIGVPSSDVMFTNGLGGASPYEPAIPTGRIPALTNQELDNYLQKLIFMENRSDSIQLWRKNILHLGGGEGLSQQNLISSNLESIRTIAEGRYMGAKVNSFFKSTTSPVETNLKQKILQSINSGLGFLTFYGHGSLNILDIDIGNHNDLSNKDKYPVMYFNGCNVGNISADLSGGVTTIGINGAAYILAKDKGAIGWMAHSNTSIITNLSAQTKAFYSNFFKDSYGSSIAEAVKTTMAKTIVPGDEVSNCHNQQLIFLGDPAYKHYTPALPDYAISNADIFITPSTASSTSDSFALAIILKNQGKAVEDSVRVLVQRTLPNGGTVLMYKMYAPVFNTDTLFFYIKSKDATTAGQNQFTVTIDPDQQITEGIESNNTASINFFMPGNSLYIISPYNYAVITDRNVHFKVQSQNIFASSESFIFEVDTSPAFNPSSAYFRSSGVITSVGSLARWTLQLPDEDNLVYHWRVRLNLPVNEGGSWQMASFTFIKSGQEGWRQSDYYQQLSIEGNEVYMDTLARKWEFVPIDETIEAYTARWRHGNLGIKTATSQFLNPLVSNCMVDGLLAIVFDRRSLSNELANKYPLNCTWLINFNISVAPAGLYYYTFNTATVQGQDDFARFIDTIQEGDYVALISRYEAKPSVWDEKVYKAIEKLGSAQIRSFTNDSMAFSLVGKKGGVTGDAQEQIIYNPTPAPVDTFLAIAKYVAKGSWYQGSLTSKYIGPAKSWGNVYCNFAPVGHQEKDSIFVDFFVKTKAGTDSLVFTVNALDSADISFINAIEYPYVRLKAHVYDKLVRTPPELKYWMVTYEPLPEGYVNTSWQLQTPKINIQEGEDIALKYSFENISTQPFDSIDIRYAVVNQNRQTIKSEIKRIAGIPKGDTAVVNYSVNSIGLSGLNSVVVSVNHDLAQPEFTLNNNSISFPIQVKNDRTNPLVDVLFDGIRITNGDIVSPTPQITVVAKDDNQYLKIKDTTSIIILYTSPKSLIPEVLSFSSPNVIFIPASANSAEAKVIFRPDRLADGLHELQVYVRDASGNPSGSKPYSIKFNVINESSITHFVPYPNPFTTSMKFVFTLTGSDVPDNIRIKIMTLTGKIVREISSVELGPLRIGNNISQFAWDGTDQFGDRLANGVYLYQVQVRYKGQEVKHRASTLDSYFIKDTGKIYLMR